MKKIFVVMTMIMTMALIVGCGQDQSGNNIKKWETNDKEAKAVIDALTTGENKSICEYSFDGKLKKINFGYEYYNGAKLVKNYNCGGIEKMDEEKINAVVGVQFEDGNYKAFHSKKEGGGGSVNGSLKGWSKKDNNVQGFSGIEEERAFEEGEKVYIAALVSGSHMADPDVLIKDKSIMKKNEKNWLFYVIFRGEK